MDILLDKNDYRYLFNFIKSSEVKIDKDKIKRYLKKIEYTKVYRKILENRRIDSDIIKTARKYIKIYKKQFSKSPIVLERMDLDLEFGVIDEKVTSGIIHKNKANNKKAALSIELTKLKEEKK